MSWNYDHDRYLAKNKAFAAAETSSWKKKGNGRNDANQGAKKATCFNCKTRQSCSEFRTKRTGGVEGAVSFGGSSDDIVFWCSKHQFAEDKNKGGADPKKIKSLMKSFKRGM